MPNARYSTAGRKRSNARSAPLSENCHGSQVRNQQGHIRQVSVPPQGGHGEIIAVSQAYDVKASAEKGIDSVRTSAPAAKVVDLTEREPAHT